LPFAIGRFPSLLNYTELAQLAVSDADSLRFASAILSTLATGTLSRRLLESLSQRNPTAPSPLLNLQVGLRNKMPERDEMKSFIQSKDTAETKKYVHPCRHQ
jgi:hypothetical protein